MKCCICNREIEVRNGWASGNNAQPVSDGRCCDECDDTYVIPARLSEFMTRIPAMRDEAEDRQ